MQWLQLPTAMNSSLTHRQRQAWRLKILLPMSRSGQRVSAVMKSVKFYTWKTGILLGKKPFYHMLDWEFTIVILNYY